MALLTDPPDFKPGAIVCVECGRKKRKDMRPTRFAGFQRGEVDPGICLINQGFLCIGSSTRGGCRAPCPRAGHPCVGCRGPSNGLIEKESAAWLSSIQRVISSLTDIPATEVDLALRSPHLSLFLFQFSDYSGPGRKPRPHEKVI
jgi:F420-non-reducing hydrogenase small subunit